MQSEVRGKKWRIGGKNPVWISIAQLRPVSIPDIVCDIAGSNPQQRIAVFDRHYMPDGVPAPEASVQGNAENHRADLKRKADCISKSLSAERSEETFENHP